MLIPSSWYSSALFPLPSSGLEELRSLNSLESHHNLSNARINLRFGFFNNCKRLAEGNVFPLQGRAGSKNRPWKIRFRAYLVMVP